MNNKDLLTIYNQLGEEDGFNPPPPEKHKSVTYGFLSTYKKVTIIQKITWNLRWIFLHENAVLSVPYF